MYKLTNYGSIIKNPDAPERSFIPLDPANTDYQQYLEWVADGNTPLPADEQGEQA